MSSAGLCSLWSSLEWNWLGNMHALQTLTCTGAVTSIYLPTTDCEEPNLKNPKNQNHKT